MLYNSNDFAGPKPDFSGNQTFAKRTLRGQISKSRSPEMPFLGNIRKKETLLSRLLYFLPMRRVVWRKKK